MQSWDQGLLQGAVVTAHPWRFMPEQFFYTAEYLWQQIKVTRQSQAYCEPVTILWAVWTTIG